MSGWRCCRVFLLTSSVGSSRRVEKSISSAHSGTWSRIRISIIRRSTKTDLRKASCTAAPGLTGIQISPESAGGRMAGWGAEIVPRGGGVRQADSHILAGYPGQRICCQQPCCENRRTPESVGQRLALAWRARWDGGVPGAYVSHPSPVAGIIDRVHLQLPAHQESVTTWIPTGSWCRLSETASDDPLKSDMDELRSRRRG